MLNLAAALGQADPGLSTTAPGTFAVKRRWDDDLIFKNQAVQEGKAGGQFVNDLLRTEFHKKFMGRFIKVRNIAWRRIAALHCGVFPLADSKFALQ